MTGVEGKESRLTLELGLGLGLGLGVTVCLDSLTAITRIKVTMATQARIRNKSGFIYW